MKKAQGLPITVIIIAILALVVLFVLIGIFGFRAQKFGKEVGEVSAGTVCDASNICDVYECEEVLVGNFVDKNGNKLPFNKVCCSTPCA